MKYLSLLVSIFNLNLLTIWLKIGAVDAIVGGDYAEFGQYRYMVSIRDNSRQHICGGAIIDSQYIITAAHCIIDKHNNFKNEKYTVVAGIVNLQLGSPGRILFDVIKAFVPAQYNQINPDPRNPEYRETGDIALLKLNGMIKFGPGYLEYINLPERKDGHYVKYLNEKPFVIGFGMEAPFNPTGKRGRGYSENNLKYIKTIILHKSKCKNMWPFVKIDDSHVCAQAHQEDPLYPAGVCDGDSGGPLVLDGTVVGILGVTRPTCNEKHFSALYTRVTAFMKFIDNVLNEIKNDETRVADYRGKTVIENVSRFTDLMGSHSKAIKPRAVV